MTNRYSEEFKADAVALVESGISQRQVCIDLGVSKAALHQWVKKSRMQARGFTLSRDPEENRELTKALRRIRELEMENNVLRAAAAYLSQDVISPKGSSRWSRD